MRLRDFMVMAFGSDEVPDCNSSGDYQGNIGADEKEWSDWGGSEIVEGLFPVGANDGLADFAIVEVVSGVERYEEREDDLNDGEDFGSFVAY